MKRILGRSSHGRSALVLLLARAAAALVGSLEPAHAQGSHVFRAMTFNIRFDFEDDGPNRWKNRADLVAACVKEAKASVVCFQEDKQDQVADLESRLSGWKLVGKGR